jgi:crossover junction endodeoxyribonuclease RuvC
MLVLGIDPGSTATGWAALRRHSGRYLLLDSGVIRTNSDDPMPERMLRIHQGLTAVLLATQPEAVAIEAIFKHRSSESALRLGQARGVALLAVAQAGLPAAEYNPMTIKKTIGGHGGAGKPELQRVIARLLGLDKPLAADANDAAAIAMTHLCHCGLRQVAQ